MGTVLWIDENVSVTKLLDKTFKRSGTSFYSHSSASNFLYLIEDLDPILVVLDSLTVKKNFELFSEQYQNSISLKKLPIILINDAPELSFISNKIGIISKPYDPFEIPEIIKKMLLETKN